MSIVSFMRFGSVSSSLLSSALAIDADDKNAPIPIADTKIKADWSSIHLFDNRDSFGGLSAALQYALLARLIKQSPLASTNHCVDLTDPRDLHTADWLGVVTFEVEQAA